MRVLTINSGQYAIFIGLMQKCYCLRLSPFGERRKSQAMYENHTGSELIAQFMAQQMAAALGMVGYSGPEGLPPVQSLRSH